MWAAGVVYTTLYNLLNYPAGVMPFGRVTEQDVQQLRDPSVYPRRGAYEKFCVKVGFGWLSDHNSSSVLLQ